MKAAVLYAPFDMRLEEVSTPDCGMDHVLVKVKAAGICGSDVHFYEGTHPYKNYPRIHGHEFAGEIVKLGENVSGFSVGDHVVIEPLKACGKCYPCRHGKYNCCTKLQVIGAHTDGGFAEYIAVETKNLHKIPQDMPFDLAAALEPYSIGAHCSNRAEITPGETVLILGVGAIGLTITDYAKLLGARVIAVDTSLARLELAKKMGADEVINPLTEDVNTRVMQLTDNEGAGIVIEATGVTKVMENTENLVASGGKIVIVGLTNDKVAFTGINFTKNEMTVLGSRNSMNVFPQIIADANNNKIHPELLVTHRFKFDNVVEAFKYAKDNISSVGKIVLIFD